jgi:hypothetical protein
VSHVYAKTKYSLYVAKVIYNQCQTAAIMSSIWQYTITNGYKNRCLTQTLENVLDLKIKQMFQKYMQIVEFVSATGYPKCGNKKHLIKCKWNKNGLFYCLLCTHILVCMLMHNHTYTVS